MSSTTVHLLCSYYVVLLYIYIYIDIFIKSWISFMDIVSLLTKLPSIFIICMIKYLLALILKTSYV
jgi:hypothetical protein